MAERRRDTEWSHPPLEPCALAPLQEGSWYGLAPTGYKLMRRVSQKQKGSALDLRNRNFNGKRGIKKNVQRSYICQRNGRGHHCCSARAFAVQPLAPSGATLRAPGVDCSARPSKEACRAHQCKTVLARAHSRNGKEGNVDREKTS